MNFYGAEGTTGKTVATINTKAFYTQGLGLLGLGNPGRSPEMLRKVRGAEARQPLGVGDAPGVEITARK